MSRTADYRVIYADTDQMGVVYHSNYLKFFEMGRNEYFRQGGFCYRELEAEGIMLPVIEVSCRYIKGAEYDDLITVSTSVTEFSRVKIKFNYQVFRGEELLARGFSLHGYMKERSRLGTIDKEKVGFFLNALDPDDRDLLVL